MPTKPVHHLWATWYAVDDDGEREDHVLCEENFGRRTLLNGMYMLLESSPDPITGSTWAKPTPIEREIWHLDEDATWLIQVGQDDDIPPQTHAVLLQERPWRDHSEYSYDYISV
jgi:hypothetical protein